MPTSYDAAVQLATVERRQAIARELHGPFDLEAVATLEDRLEKRD